MAVLGRGWAGTTPKKKSTAALQERHYFTAG